MLEAPGGQSKENRQVWKGIWNPRSGQWRLGYQVPAVGVSQGGRCRRSLGGGGRPAAWERGWLHAITGRGCKNTVEQERFGPARWGAERP